nr:hypothetical protein [Tanacetum cinerariifolium]
YSDNEGLLLLRCTRSTCLTQLDMLFAPQYVELEAAKFSHKLI